MAKLCYSDNIDGINFLSSKKPFKTTHKKIKKNSNSNTIWICPLCYKGFKIKGRYSHFRACKNKNL